MTQAPKSHWLNWLYGVGQVQRRILQEHPNEPIHFASGAMLVPKQKPDDHLQRVTASARRGVFVATSERLVFETSLFMPFNVLFMVAGLGSLLLWLNGGGFPAILLAAIATATIIRRRPYRLELPQATIQRIVLKNVDGLTGPYHSLIVHTQAASYQVIATNPLPADVRATLSQQ